MLFQIRRTQKVPTGVRAVWTWSDALADKSTETADQHWIAPVLRKAGLTVKWAGRNLENSICAVGVKNRIEP